MKKIMILKEHHGSVVLDISTPDQLQRAALSVVKGRFSGDNDYYLVEMPEAPQDPGFTNADVEKMPSALRENAFTALEEHGRKLEFYKRELREYEMLKRCIDTDDGKLAVRILNMRKGYEDEGFETYEVHDTYPT